MSAVRHLGALALLFGCGIIDAMTTSDIVQLISLIILALAQLLRAVAAIIRELKSGGRNSKKTSSPLVRVACGRW